MIKQDKDLVYKDISARLPYDVIVHVIDPSTRTHDTYLHEAILARLGNNQAIVKPYLRPMSSMTMKECEELGELPGTIENVGETLPNVPYYIEVARPEQIDWLNAHHFDYRGLIPKGLAIEVTNENNPYK